MQSINILGVRVHPISKDILHTQINKFIRNQAHALILHTNAHCLNLAYKDKELQGFLNKAQITFSDGAGVLLGAHLLGFQIPERITYADWMWQLTGFAEHQEFSFYFLGAKPGVAQKAQQQLEKKYPKIKIIGTQHGYFNKIPGHPENEAVIQHINSLRPNILIVGFGMPLQEKWLMENWEHIDANIALTGGAVFDYISGELRRAPQWMTNSGFEWFGRLIIEPRRLWKRYLVGNPLFIWRVLKQKYGLLKID
jgi:N-acetylglucosaminyldiphosphoundecaprenol N-acetyl-beta-D-mannosaminyltransferase